MKKLIAIPAVVFCTLVLFTSCTKSSSDSFDQNTNLVPDKIITATVSAGQSHVVTINDIGNLSIVRQASHFKISQTGIDPKYKSLLYTYSPAEGFTGSDEVLLVHKIHTGSSSDVSCNTDGQSSRIWTTYIAVKITVAN
jgi:hypothetical protein